MGYGGATSTEVATMREQRPGPDKMIYLKRMADFDRLISICSSKLASNPTNVRALMIRASSYMKKRTPQLTPECCNTARQHVLGDPKLHRVGVGCSPGLSVASKRC